VSSCRALLACAVALGVLLASGHASVATTGRYLHARPTDSSARYLPLYRLVVPEQAQGSPDVSNEQRSAETNLQVSPDKVREFLDEVQRQFDPPFSSVTYGEKRSQHHFQTLLMAGKPPRQVPSLVGPLLRFAPPSAK
jgi:hypothetical protein